jgi:hypothetical protein
MPAVSACVLYVSELFMKVASLVHINNHLEEVRRQDPDLAHQLQKLAEEFNYGKILARLECCVIL